jgi:hypothetical protein
VKDSRILDFVEIVNAGESGLRVGDHIEKEEAARLNAGLKKAGKRPIDVIPVQLLSVGVGRGQAHHRAGQYRVQREGVRSPKTW